jgi:hypothetical protein
VWYEHGVAIDGCRRQPIAAVRSDSSVRNIILCGVVVLALRLSQNNVMGFARAFRGFLFGLAQPWNPTMEWKSTTPRKRRHDL